VSLYVVLVNIVPKSLHASWWKTMRLLKRTSRKRARNMGPRRAIEENNKLSGQLFYT